MAKARDDYERITGHDLPEGTEITFENLKTFEELADMTRAKKKAETTAIDATLDERGKRYGSFTGHADITQNLKHDMMASPKWGSLANDQKEALEMIAHKIGRILNGDPNYHDSWHDIVGYAMLVADRLETGVEK